MTVWMVVEDEPDVYEMVLAMYETLGIDGVAFTTGEEAITWIDEFDAAPTSLEPPQLALLDIRLPGDIDGTMIGQRLGQSPVLSRTRIVLMTAYRLSAAEERACLQRAGADLMIYKPLPDLKSFGRKMIELINQR